MAQLILRLTLFVSELTCKKWGKLDTLVLSVAERGRSQEGVGICKTCKAVVMLTVLE